MSKKGNKVIKSISISNESNFHLSNILRKDRNFNFSKWVDFMIKSELSNSDVYLESKFKLIMGEANETLDEMRKVGIKKINPLEQTEEYQQLILKNRNRKIDEVIQNDN